MLGTHCCGNQVMVNFTSSHVRWYPAEGYPHPDGSYALISVPLSSVTRIEIDKIMGSIAIWSMFEPPFDASGKFLPFCAHTEPESSIYFEYDVSDFYDQFAPPSEIMKLAPRLRPLMSFMNPGKMSGRARLSYTRSGHARS